MNIRVMGLPPRPKQSRRSRRRKRLITFLVALIGILIISGYAFLHSFARHWSEKVFWALGKHGTTLGVEDLRPGFEKVQFDFPNGVVWKDVAASFTLRNRVTNNHPVSLFVRAKEVRVRLLSPLNMTAALEVKDAVLGPSGSDSSTLPTGLKPTSEAPRALYRFKVSVRRFRFPFDMNLKNPDIMFRELMSGLGAIASGTEIDSDFHFDGRTEFLVNQTPQQIGLVDKVIDGGRLLVLKKKDLKVLTESIGSDYSAAEINVVSRHPLQAPVLLEIKERATRQADRMHELDNEIPTDAYRHILWSFLLTRHFSASFAKEVTDAHEKGVEGTLQAADSLKDYSNNELGRRYAQARVPEEELVLKVKNDPLVMK